MDFGGVPSFPLSRLEWADVFLKAEVSLGWPLILQDLSREGLGTTSYIVSMKGTSITWYLLWIIGRQHITAQWVMCDSIPRILVVPLVLSSAGCRSCVHGRWAPQDLQKLLLLAELMQAVDATREPLSRKQALLRFSELMLFEQLITCFGALHLRSVT